MADVDTVFPFCYPGNIGLYRTSTGKHAICF